jgi:hypothetical protein
VSIGLALVFFSHFKLILKVRDVCCWLLMFSISLYIFHGFVVGIAMLDGPICQAAKVAVVKSESMGDDRPEHSSS